MKSFNLSLINLNNRPYLHGTSIVKGVLDAIWSEYPTIQNFEIRLKAKLATQPLMIISENLEVVDGVVAVGKFQYNNTQLYFYLLPTEKNCTEKLIIDELSLGSRLYETDTEWCMDIITSDDIHICLNEVSKISNQDLFAIQPGITMEKGKQTWFVGYKLTSLDFLNSPCSVIGISKKYKMLTANCMERYISINGNSVGSRTCIYA